MRRNAEPTNGTSNAALFGEVLRHYREGALLTQEALARQIPCDRSQVAKIEAGTRVPSDQFAKRCDEVLDTGGMLIRMWVKIDWYPAAQHPEWFERRVEMEEVCVSLRQYQEKVVAGLLQTPGYARALFSQVFAPEEVEARVQARMSRQPRFLSDDSPLLIVTLDESCLRQPVGGPEVMYDQLAHLLSAGQRPNIRIQVAPTARFELPRPKTSMALIELPDERWIYSESLERSHFDGEATTYARYSRTYDVLRADSLSARESADLIRDLMEEYEDHGRSGSERGGLDQEQPQRQRRRRLRRSRPRYPRPPRPRPGQQEP